MVSKRFGVRDLFQTEEPERTLYTGATSRESRLDWPVALIYDRGVVSYEQACKSMEIGKVYERYGEWVVTDYGLECLALPYQISVDRLWGEWTLRHMSQKRWVVYTDFAAAFEAARAFHRRRAPSKPVPAAVRPERPVTPGNDRRPRPRTSLSNKVRFLILKRDKYVCQICGRSGANGYQLHIDHKVPRAKGGSDSMDNLWVLCSICNSGKGVEDL